MFKINWQFVVFAKIYKQNSPCYKVNAKRIKVQLFCKQPEATAEISQDDYVMRFPDSPVININLIREKSA